MVMLKPNLLKNCFTNYPNLVPLRIASVARRLSTTLVDPRGLSAVVACRLIALEKCPGVRPICIGETVRRIIGKAIATTITEDIQEAAGPLQVCAGHVSGCEAAVHAM